MATDRRDINVRPFVAYLDRSNLSVTLPTITHDLNIDGATASIVLTIFLIGYAFSNILAAYLPSDTIRKNSHSDGANLVDCDRFCRIYLVSVRYFDLSAGAWHYRRHLLAAAVPLRQRLVFRQERTQANSIISIMDSSRH